MRKLIVSAMVSLDGVMQAPGGPEEDTSGGFEFGGWVFPYFDEAGGQAVHDKFAQPFDLLLGRKTYDIFAAYWPHQGPGNFIAERFDAVTKYVATRSDDAFDWVNTKPLRGDALAQVAALKKSEGPPLLTQGSTVLIQDLWNAGLVDELHLMTFPVVLGKGKRLFEPSAGPGAMRLTRASTTPTGVTMAEYATDGAVKTGSFV